MGESGGKPSINVNRPACWKAPSSLPHFFCSAGRMRWTLQHHNVCMETAPERGDAATHIFAALARALAILLRYADSELRALQESA